MPLSCIRQRVINGYQHIVACPISRSWALLVIVHFIVQIALQGITLRDNVQAKNATSPCLSLAQVPVGLPLLEGGNLSMCDGIPEHKNVTCIVITSVGGSSLTTRSNADANSLTNFDLDEIHNITLSGSEHFITGRCVLSLRLIHDVFRDNAAEDIATICFQFWLLIVSLLAAIQDSIPHLAVSIASHVLDVGWAGFRIGNTIILRQNYYKFVVDGACGGEDLLGNWWDQRLAHAAPLFGTNVITFILLGALSVILFRQYAKINFSRIGASARITRMYKIALSFSAFLQLAAFFTIMAVGMWIYRVSCSPMTTLIPNIRIYQASFVVLAVIIAPWVISGWWAIFREIEWAFILFGGLHLFLLVFWPVMFATTIYRYIFVSWSFFAGVTVTSYLLVAITTIMAIICRLHFGRGLGHFLRVEADLSSSGFPGSFFTNDPTHSHGGSPTSFNFGILDTEKARKGSTEKDNEGPVDIRSYTLDSTRYSVHSLSFETSANGLKTPAMVSIRPRSATSAATVRTLNKGSDKPLPKVVVDSESRPVSYLSHTDINGPKSTTLSTTFARDKERSWIQTPPEVHLQTPYKETRPRKETPSMTTQGTCVSSNSYSQAVITFAMKNSVVSATARTVTTSATPSRRTPSPVDTVIPHEDRPSIEIMPQQKPILVRDVNGTRQATQSATRETADGAGQD